MITSNTKDFKGRITLKVITPFGDSLANTQMPCTIGMLQYAGKEALA
jgi:hypothetical protein